MLIRSAVAMVTYWCIRLLGVSASLLALIAQLRLREDEEKPGRITSIHLLCAMNLTFGLLSVFLSEIFFLNFKFPQIRTFSETNLLHKYSR